MIRFPSIRQYSDVIRYVTDRMQFAGNDAEGNATYHKYTVKKPTLRFRGTPKLHGANAAVVLNVETGEITYQSRDNELTLEKDLFSFMATMQHKTAQMQKIFKAALAQQTTPPTHVAVFGEWCGGEVQNNVALAKLPKMFCFFAVKMVTGKRPDGSNDGYWIDIASLTHVDSSQDQIYNTLRFGAWQFEIDFERPKMVQNDLADLTIAVEENCPVGKCFGVDGVGEGVVWTCAEDGWDPYKYSFKVVGQKHAKTKRRQLPEVDVVTVKALEDFVTMTVTQARLEQGLFVLKNELQKPFALTSQGDFARWVYNDIIKEEMPTIEKSNLDPKKLGAPISVKARYWYVEQLKVQGLM